MTLSTTAVLAAGLAALGAALLVAAPSQVPRPIDRRPHRLVVPLLLLGVGVVLVLSLHGVQLVLGLLALISARLALGLVTRARRAADADRRTDQVLLACESLSSDLSAGQPPLAALDRVAVDWPEFRPVATAARLGADVPAAMRDVAGLPGADQLRVMAATWHVAHRSGSGLATALDETVAGIRADRATLQVVAAELASARATARLMAVLPFGVLLMGSGLGGDPFGFLFGTPVGLACLGVGGVFSYAGLRWLQAISDGVLRR